MGDQLEMLHPNQWFLKIRSTRPWCDASPCAWKKPMIRCGAHLRISRSLMRTLAPRQGLPLQDLQSVLPSYTHCWLRLVWGLPRCGAARVSLLRGPLRSNSQEFFSWRNETGQSMAHFLRHGTGVWLLFCVSRQIESCSSRRQK